MLIKKKAVLFETPRALSFLFEIVTPLKPLYANPASAVSNLPGEVQSISTLNGKTSNDAGVAKTALIIRPLRSDDNIDSDNISGQINKPPAFNIPTHNDHDGDAIGAACDSNDDLADADGKDTPNRLRAIQNRKV